MKNGTRASFCDNCHAMFKKNMKCDYCF